MLQWFGQLDRILRGSATRPEALESGSIDMSVRGVSVVLLALGMIYGACMGLFSVIAGGGKTYSQLLATTAKVPALFFLTLVVTFPSLYVFNALIGSRLTMISTLRLLVSALGVMLAVLASFGTIVAFFSVCTSSYPFMVVLNVAIFAVAGFLGLMFLLRTLQRLTPADELPLAVPVELEEGQPQMPVQVARSANPDRRVRVIFRIWVFLFSLVGAQMAWVLRPFIGSPNAHFTLFRPRTGNFFESVWNALHQLISG